MDKTSLKLQKENVPAAAPAEASYMISLGLRRSPTAAAVILKNLFHRSERKTVKLIKVSKIPPISASCNM